MCQRRGNMLDGKTRKRLALSKVDQFDPEALRTGRHGAVGVEERLFLELDFVSLGAGRSDGAGEFLFAAI